MRPNARARDLERERGRTTIEYRTNSLGMRDPERAIPKPPGVLRVLMLGDSFVEGQNVRAEDTVAAIMERELSSPGGRPVEVINGGCVSFSPILEYLFLKEVGLRLEPDVVVLNLDMSDIQDDMAYGLMAEYGTDGEPLRVVPEDLDGTWPRNPDAVAGAAQREADAFRDRYFHTRALVMDDGLRGAFDRTWGHISRTARLCRRRGIRFLLTAYPMGHQVNAVEWGAGRAERGFESRVYEGPIFAYLEERAEEEDMPFLNLLDGFREAAERPLFFPRDGHWTRAGHRLAAQLIGADLRARGWISEGPPVLAHSPSTGNEAEFGNRSASEREILARKTLAAIAAGDAAAAAAVSERLLAVARDEGTLVLRGRALALGKDLAGARAALEQSRDIAPTAESAYRLGWIALQEGKRGEAEERWRETARLTPHHERVDYNLGILLLEQGRPSEALPYLEAAVASFRGDADAWNSLGIALALTGKTEEARGAFGRALAENPRHEGARTNIARIGVHRNRLAQDEDQPEVRGNSRGGVSP